LILLSVGTHRQPFPRALDLVEPLARQGIEVIVQHGSTVPRPDMPNTTWFELMAFDELVETMARADNVICHAGVGTIMTALQQGHTPVVIPRQARHDEHVDDHQLEIAMRFVERDLIRCVNSETDLAPLLVPRSDTIQRIGKGSRELRATVLEAVAAGPNRGRFALHR
jgi:UDP-N-acetylglucosamine transferase subunit ALG13